MFHAVWSQKLRNCRFDCCAERANRASETRPLMNWPRLADGFNRSFVPTAPNEAHDLTHIVRRPGLVSSVGFDLWSNRHSLMCVHWLDIACSPPCPPKGNAALRVCLVFVIALSCSMRPCLHGLRRVDSRCLPRATPVLRRSGTVRVGQQRARTKRHERLLDPRDIRAGHGR